MQSFFAIKTIDELFIWLDILKPKNNFSIWKIEFNHNNYSHLDSTWLMGDIYRFSSLATTYRANKYWTGEISDNPKMVLLIKPPIKIIEKVKM